MHTVKQMELKPGYFVPSSQETNLSSCRPAVSKSQELITLVVVAVINL